MAAKLTAKDLEVISHVMIAEQMACKKAQVYSKTVTDPAISECMEKISMCHRKRFDALYSVISGN